MRVEWIVRYEDGGEVSNLEAEPWEIRSHGVMAVIQRDPIVDVEILKSSPGIWAWKHGQWVAFQSDWAMYDYIWHYQAEHKVILTGEILPDPLWANRKEMYEDTKRMFGIGKTSFKSGEDEFLKDVSK